MNTDLYTFHNFDKYFKYNMMLNDHTNLNIKNYTNVIFNKYLEYFIDTKNFNLIQSIFNYITYILYPNVIFEQACLSCDMDIVKLIVEHNDIDINNIYYVIHLQGEYNILYALNMDSRFINIYELLINKGIDVNLNYNKENSNNLFVAIHHQNYILAKFLISKTLININLLNNQYEHVIYKLYINDQICTIKILLERPDLQFELCIFNAFLFEKNNKDFASFIFSLNYSYDGKIVLNLIEKFENEKQYKIIDNKTRHLLENKIFSPSKSAAKIQ